jgi:hypothetical protein
MAGGVEGSTCHDGVFRVQDVLNPQLYCPPGKYSHDDLPGTVGF